MDFKDSRTHSRGDLHGAKAIGDHMIKGYDIRPWRPGDERHILNLFEASFGRKLTPEFWNWRFRSHPAGGPLIMLAWDGDRLAAHYGASQAPIVVDGTVLPAALSMTTMTHPNDRGRGLVEALGEALYDSLKAQSYVAVWGFPNAMINATRQRKLAWQPICDVPTLSVQTAQARIPDHAQDPELPVKITPRTDTRFAALNADLALSGTLRGQRSADILSWRVDANPQNIYTRYIIEAGPTHAELMGYAIAKRFGYQALDIVEILGVDDAHISALLTAIVSSARQEGISQINSWSLNNDPTRLTFERAGFAATAPVTYLGGRAFDPKAGDLTDARRWRLAMLDSDLY